MGEVSTKRLGDLDESVSALIYGAALAEAELITRQYLGARTVGIELSQALLFALSTKSPVIHPLPSEWQMVLINHGFAVATGRCSFAFARRVGMLWVFGVLRIAKQMLAQVRELIRPSSGRPRHYAYFFSLTKNNLPQSRREGTSYDIFSWYAGWKGRARPLESLCHSVGDAEDCETCGLRVQFMPSPIPPITTLAGTRRFITWAIKAIFVSIFDLMRGKWWHALMLSEASLAARVRYQDVEKLPKDCLFNTSSSVYRPMWTYEAERRGVRITFYAYAMGDVWIWQGEKGYYSKVCYEWELINWPLYLAWGKEHADFIRMTVGGAPKIEVAGPVWFGDSAVELPELPIKSVAVFDVQPHRSSFHQSRCPPAHFAVPEDVNQFLMDIYSVLKDCGYTMVHKRKRNIGKLLHPKYAALVKRLSQASGYIAIEPDTSPLRVIQGCQAVISMPFTSTALYGRFLGKPSIYYYPNGLIQKDDLAGYGIPVLCGRDELQEWVMRVFGALTESEVSESGL